MENTKKSLSDSILELTKSVTPEGVSESVSEGVSEVVPDLSSTSSSGSGFFGFISSISWFTWLMIIIFFAFLGFNIFYYLAEGTQDITNVFAPLLQRFFGITIGTASQAVDMAAEGAKAVTETTATGIETGLSAVQDITPTKTKSSVSSTQYEEEDEIQEAKNSLKSAINRSNSKNDDDYEPNEASSSVHIGKAGWCFIGEDRGFRTCSKVTENDKCMSGDIFPSQNLCIHPNLRS
jgi:hypothetical protein